MAAAYHHSWIIEQGALSEFQFQLKDDADEPINTTGLSGRGQVRSAPGGTLYGDLTVSVVNHLTGTWKVQCLPAALANYAFGARKNSTDFVMGAFDVELYDPADVTNVKRWIQGDVRISVECTK